MNLPRPPRNPKPGVGVLQVHLIPDSPKQQRRVVFVFQDFLLELGQLTFHSMHVVVIHARSLRPQVQPQHDRHPAGMRRIQKGRFVGAPKPNGIGA